MAALSRRPTLSNCHPNLPLPLLAKALHRHLRELPSSMNGLSFTEEMALQLLAEDEINLNAIRSPVRATSRCVTAC
jgi:hypothetical protein